MSRLLEKILCGLNDIGYHGPMLNKEKLEAAVEVGQKSVDYTKLVNFLTNEIRSLAGIDEEVNAITSPEDAVAFIMEITSFLKELNCPYTSLTGGLVSERLQNVSDRLLLLDYLITELMGARILQDRKPDKKIELKLQETSEGADMRQILQTLRFPKPPANITVKQLFDKLDMTIPIVLSKAGTDLVGKGIFNGTLSEKQWETLNGVQADLNNEYKIRREMLLTRLDVTIQSFQWSDRTKGKDEIFEKIYHDKRKMLRVEPEVDISDLLAARTDLAIIEKTSSVSVRKNTQSAIHKVIIGQVPDRGGRSWEQPPPPPEMPSWQQRSNQPMGGGGPGGRGGSSNYNRGGSQGNRGGGGQFNRGGSGGRGGGGGRGGSGYNRDSGYQNQKEDSYNSGFASQHNSSNDYGNSYSRGGNDSYRKNDSFERDSYGRGNDSFRGGDNYNYGNRRDSGGSYGSQDYQQNKRPKTYDSYQPNKSTYADQYVQEREHNQQYRRGGGGRGRGNYRRGNNNYY